MKRILHPFIGLIRHAAYGMMIHAMLSPSLFATEGTRSQHWGLKEVRLTLEFNDASLPEAFSVIEAKSEFRFNYNIYSFDSNLRVSGRYRDTPLYDILLDISRQANVKFRQVGDNISVTPKLKTEQKDKPAEVIIQIRKVTGKVTSSEDGEPLPGVTILEKGTGNGTVTDAEGMYSLEVNDGATLVFSSIGYQRAEVEVGNRSVIDFAMALDVQQLEELVIVGFGSQEKATVTGAISSTDSEKLVQSPVANISNALTGRVSGLLTVQTSGAPGYDESNLRIRGTGTFTGQNSPLIMVDGVAAQNFNNIDPNEIKNITILKDASATAVYGVRGANGVVLITTKRGEVGKPQVSMSAQTAVSAVAVPRHYLRSPEWAQGHTEATAYDSYTLGTYNPRYTEEDIQKYRDQTDPLFYPDVDWVSLVLKPTASQSQYNFNISGGLENVKYFISLGNFTQGGLFNGDVYDTGYDSEIGYNRYNIRSNFDFDVTKRLTIKVNFSSQIEKFKGNPQPAGSAVQFGNYMAKLYATPPNVSPGVWDGKIVNLNTQAGQFYQNPLNRFFGLPFQRSNTNFMNGIMRADYELDFLAKGLSVHSTISYQGRNSVIQTIEKPLVEYLAFPIEGGGYGLGPQQEEGPFEFSESTNFNRIEYFEAGLDYRREIGDHAVSGLLLYNQSKEYPGPSLSIPSGYQGLVGRATYDFKRRYMAEFNFGYNGTENFAVGKRFGFFPAFSLGWAASEEAFFPENNLITFLKIRGSYGEVGNDRIGGTRFLYNPTSYLYGGESDYAFGIAGQNLQRYTGAGEGTIGNPNVTWERAKKTDIGIDLSVGQSINITVDYFQEVRDNILANPQTVPNIVGPNLPAYNFGKMENRGVDGEVSYYSHPREFNYWGKFVFTLTDNKIIFRDEPPQPMPYRAQTGQRDGQYFGLLEEGFYNTWDEVIEAYRPMSSYSSNKIQPGDFKYKDINGDGIIDSHDQVPLGYSAFPNSSFGLAFGGDYKGFSISVLVQAASRYSHRSSKTFIRGWADGNGSTQAFIYDNAWTYERYMAGEEITMPRIGVAHTNQHNYQFNSRWIQDASYVRLKNVEIGYALPKSFLNRFGISQFRFFLSGNNLLVVSKLDPGQDPETPTWSDSDNEPYPLMRTFNGGINIQL